MDAMSYPLTFAFLAGTVACAALAWALLAVRDPRPPAAGPGVALVPVVALWLWAVGITAVRYSPRSNANFSLVPEQAGGGPLLPTLTQTSALLTGLLIVAATALLTLLLRRTAAYLAAAGLLVFAVYGAYACIVLQPRVYASGYYWYDWMLSTSRSLVWVLVCASAVASFALPRNAILADLKAHKLLTTRVERLTRTRAEAVDFAAAELRRLERDLHDGAQARLVALGINLRAAEKLVRTNPDAAAALIAECREVSSRALADLRDLVRGIYPPVLADRGLGAAVEALALDCPVPVVTEIGLPGRPPVPVESAVYFAVAEALNNVAKHAGATCAHVRMAHAAGLLRAEITDDGTGGANTENGTGLAGMERRLAAFDGILAVHSPAGGPTIIVIEVPCALSSPKISTC